MKKIVIISPLLGDVAIPLVGFLFWGWGFYFIALFFLFDLLFRTLFLKKRVSTLPDFSQRNKFLFKGFLYPFIEFVLIHCIVVVSFSSLSIGDAFIDFLTYEDLGIQQGIVIIPLLFLNEVMKIRNEKKMGIPASVRTQILLNSQKVQVYRTVFWVILYLLVLFLNIPESILIIAFFIVLTVQPFVVFRNVN